MWANKNISYEVMTGEGGRWLIDSTHKSRQPAMNRAQSLVEANQHDAVKVTREEEGKEDEVVFQKECAGRAEKPMSIAAIEDSPVCATLDDLYGFEARKTVGRLLREYLDEFGLTATELMHDFSQIRSLARLDTFYNQAIHRASSIQARALKEKPTERNDVLYGLIHEATERAKKAKDIDPLVAIRKEQGLTAAIEAAAAKPPKAGAEYAYGALVASLLSQARDWKKKLDLVLDEVEKAPGENVLNHMDGAVAEILDGSEAVKEILGPKADLGEALRTIARVAAGRYGDGKEGKSTVSRLNAVMAKYATSPHGLPHTQAILLERVARAVQGVQPFTRESDEQDRSIFLALLQDLTGFGGINGGREMSSAVTRRARMVLSRGDEGDLTPEAGIDAILALLPSVAVKLGYLLDLSASEFGAKYQKAVLQALLANVQSIKNMSELVPAGSSKEFLVRAVADLQTRLGSGMLAEELGALVSQRLDALLAEDEALAVSTGAPVAASGQKPKDAGALNQRTFAAGEYLFREGEPGDEAYMIKSGEVEISIQAGGKDMPIATVGHGEIIGEMALIDNQPRMASAKAVTDTALTVLPQESFKLRLDRLADSDRVLHHLLEVFVTRLRDLARNI